MFRYRCLFVALACPVTIAVAGTGPNPYCVADLAEPFGRLDLFDVGAFLEAYNLQGAAADLAAPSGVWDFFDAAAYLTAYGQGCPPDADGDRLPDSVETDDGVFLNLYATGTNPFSPDTDTDSIPDGDEALGTIDGLDLPAMGASPLRKDIFVECDWFAGVFEGRTEDFRPTPASVARLVAAFADAPVQNPYGLGDGVSIHLDYGQGGGFTGGNLLPGAPVFIDFGDEFDAYKVVFFDPRRLGYFHYAIFANRYNSASNNSSGVAEINGDDFMVTMAYYFSSYNQSQTVMHELGHNLGLLHGGYNNVNRKPNYNSVMNYRHQFPGADTNGDTFGDGRLDYSFGVNYDLDEAALFEPLGVLGTPVDLDGDGVISPTPVARNINCTVSTQPCGSGVGCEDLVCTVLLDSNDWSGINWHRLDQRPGRGAPEVIECENAPETAGASVVVRPG